MKPFDEQDHYEILEVSRDAKPAEIERAYRLACSVYEADSLAGHSVFEEADLALIRERLDGAYRTLSDPEARRAYDAGLERGQATETAPRGGEDAEAAAEPRSLPLEPFEDLEPDTGEFDGARLRRARLRRGVELEEIAGTTKINPTYLRCLEEERFAELPAAVYVRGFVMGYASCVGLDPKRVARSYMKRYGERRNHPRRGLFSRH